MGITIEQLKTEYPDYSFNSIKSLVVKETDGSFIGNANNVKILKDKIMIISNNGLTYGQSQELSYYYIRPDDANSNVTIEELCSDKVKIIPLIEYTNSNHTFLDFLILNKLGKTIKIVSGWADESGNNRMAWSYTIYDGESKVCRCYNLSATSTENELTFLKYPPFLYVDNYSVINHGLKSSELDFVIKTYSGVYDSSITDEHKALIYNSVFLDTDNPPIPERPDYMDLNVPGNSEQPNARYEFVNPVAGLAYTTAQKIIFDWDITGATKNPYVKKHVEFNIPANSHCFVLFTGKYVGVYCTAPTNFVMDVYNGNTAIGQVTKQSAGGVLEIQDLFGMYEGYEPVGGVYNVKIQTPFVFIRQIYKCASRDQLPQKGSPTYEIFQPGTSSAYVNPNDTGELASVHFLKAESLAALKAAADAEYKGGV